MELIDSHAHIDFPQFAEDREAMLDRARAAGVTALLAIGTGPGPEKLDSALPFAEHHDWIYATVGIHPHEAKQVTQQHLADLARLAKHPKVIAWGEIGLDYYYDHSPRDDFGMLRQPGQVSQMLLRYLLRFVGMDADGGVNPIMMFGKWQRGIELLRSGARADGEECRHACRAGAIEHGFAVFGELREVDVRV